MTEGTYDTAEICENGHLITGSSEDFPEHRKKFCEDCGAKTIRNCSSCNSSIKGHLRGVIIFHQMDVPKFCHECGNPYPWTKSGTDAAKELIQELALDEVEKNELSKAIDNLVTDSPQTQLASMKYKRLIAKAGVEGGKALKDILIGIASETAKKLIWG